MYRIFLDKFSVDSYTIQCHHKVVICRIWAQLFKLLLWETFLATLKNFYLSALKYSLFRQIKIGIDSIKYSCECWSLTTYKFFCENNANADPNRKYQSKILWPHWFFVWFNYLGKNIQTASDQKWDNGKWMVVKQRIT